MMVGYYIGEKIYEIRMVGPSMMKQFENRVMIAILALSIFGILFTIIKACVLKKPYH